MSEPSANHACQGASEPWAFPTDAYERDQDQVILKSLLRGRYARAFESGCGTGLLTAQLAHSCQRLIAIDIAPTRVARARIRCSHLHQVSVRCAGLTEYLPDGPLDLVILRDAAHPLSAAELLRVGLELSERLAPRGELIALHRVETRVASPMTCKSIHEMLNVNLPLDWTRGETGVGYCLDSWIKH